MSAIKVSARNNLDAVQNNKTPDAKRTIEGLKLPQVNNPGENFDKVQVSNRATDVRKLVEKLAKTPDAERAERVAALRQKVEAGEYNPSSTEIADAIIEAEKE